MPNRGYNDGHWQEQEIIMSDKLIDARGQKCPMPLLMAKRGLRDMAPGAVLELLATDPGSTKDFQSLHRLAGHGVESQALEEGSYRHCITKAAS